MCAHIFILTNQDTQQKSISVCGIVYEPSTENNIF